MAKYLKEKKPSTPAGDIAGNRKEKRRWQKVVTFLACVVVFCTTYALILPAITMERNCAIPEHTHSEECYRQVTSRSVTRLHCPLEGEQESIILHTHDASCLDGQGVLVCPLPEREAHTHGEDCYALPQPHVHGEQCYTSIRGELVCQLEEEPGHTHGEECYVTHTIQDCLLEESEGHTHGEDCYAWERELSCTLPEDVPEDAQPELTCTLEELELHTHTPECCDEESALLCTLPQVVLHSHGEDCFETLEEPVDTETLTCTLEETQGHTHEDACYEVSSRLICAMEEDETHAHGEDCYALEQLPVCGLPEEAGHTHGPLCYGTWELICTQQEHTHSEACTPKEMQTQQFLYEDDQLILTVDAESLGPLPEDTRLHVSVPEWDAAVLADRQQEEGDGQWMLRDICLVQGETPLEDADITLRVTIQVKSPVLEALPASAVLDEDAGQALEVVAWQVDGEANFLPLDVAMFPVGEQIPALTAQIQPGTLVVLAGVPDNPQYTVQYYAPVARAHTSGSGQTLSLIDTRGGRLPKNNDSSTQTTISLPLRQVENRVTDKNNGKATPLYMVNTQEELTRMYTDETFYYVKAPNPAYIDKLEDSYGYDLVKLWVLKGADPESILEEDWEIHDAGSIHFTNREDFAQANRDKNVIYIGQGTVLRLVYEKTKDSFTAPATFYDYDITGGKNSENRWETTYYGINSQENYGKSRDETVSWSSKKNALAFGNNNTGTALSEYAFGNYGTLNATNENNLEGCTFQLASSMANGTIQYHPSLIAPKLFNDGEAKGKTTYEGSSLTFNRVGDTYTLSAAQAAGLSPITGLEYLFNPSPNSGTVYTHIFTNDFWPMDTATNKVDPLFGGGTTVRFAGKTSGAFPPSDDGWAHNSYFGMQFAVEFTLTKDYVGPLDYTFFGDDDMWVFLDGQLVCDIGGVHSSVGEYVDLWDYLDKDDDQTHTLHFFYTERGASGSTCYMSFTLPSVSGIHISQKTASLRVEKQVVGDIDPDTEFTFQIQFFNSAGQSVLDDYVYDRYDADGTPLESNLIICDGGEFTLKHGQYVRIEHLPYGLQYKITELGADGYTITNTVNGTVTPGGTATGSIQKGSQPSVLFTNTASRVGISLQKQDADGKSLSGAVFRLLGKEDVPLTFSREADGYHVLQSPGNIPRSSGATELEVDEHGRLAILELIPGRYLLEEITAPTGCVLPEEKAELYVRADGTIETAAGWISTNGSLLTVTNAYQNQVLTLEKKVENVTTTRPFRFCVTYTKPGEQTPVTEYVELAHGQSTTLTIPYGREVTIREENPAGYALRFERDGNVLPAGEDGSITFTLTQDMSILAVNTGGYSLPNTGGPGLLPAALITTLAALALLWKKRKPNYA